MNVVLAHLLKNNRFMIHKTLDGLLITVTGIILTFLLQMVLSRTLGEHQFGIYTYAISWINVLHLLPALGMNSAILRYVPAYLALGEAGKAKGMLLRSFQIVFAAAVGCTLVVVGVLMAIRNSMPPELYHVFLLSTPLIPVLALSLLNGAAVQAQKHVVHSQLPRLVIRPLVFSAIVLFVVYLKKTPFLSPDAMRFDLAATTTAFFIGAYLVIKSLPVDLTQARPQYRTIEWLRTSVPMLITTEFTIALKRIDIILIGAIRGTTEAGIYAIASMLSQLLTFGLKSSNLMAEPLASGYYAKNQKAALQSIANIAAGLASVWCLVLGGGLILFKDIALHFFGQAFTEGGIALVILCLGQFTNALTGPTDVMLNATGHQDIIAKITIIVVIGNLLFNAPAIYLWGMNGSAMVTAIMIAAKNIWSWWEVRRRIGIDTSLFSWRAPKLGGLN